MTIVVRNATVATRNPPPSRTETEAAIAAQAMVAVHRLYGCGAVVMAVSASCAWSGVIASRRIRRVRRSTAASRVKSIER